MVFHVTQPSRYCKEFCIQKDISCHKNNARTRLLANPPEQYQGCKLLYGNQIATVLLLGTAI